LIDSINSLPPGLREQLIPVDTAEVIERKHHYPRGHLSGNGEPGHDRVRTDTGKRAACHRRCVRVRGTSARGDGQKTDSGWWSVTIPIL
jgi:hypothetical protein